MRSSRIPASLLFCAAAFAALIAALVWRSAPAPKPSLEVKVIAHQWWWEFEYPSLGIRTRNALYLPSGQHIQLDLASADVVHSFWIQGLNDAISLPPGRTRELDLDVRSAGDLEGNCDSTCGCGSVCMSFKVIAERPAEFQRWAAHEFADPTPWLAPAHMSTPECALQNGSDRHPKERSAPATSRLQRLLDDPTPTTPLPKNAS